VSCHHRELSADLAIRVNRSRGVWPAALGQHDHHGQRDEPADGERWTAHSTGGRHAPPERIEAGSEPLGPRLAQGRRTIPG